MQLSFPTSSSATSLRLPCAKTDAEAASNHNQPTLSNLKHDTFQKRPQFGGGPKEAYHGVDINGRHFDKVLNPTGKKSSSGNPIFMQTLCNGVTSGPYELIPKGSGEYDLKPLNQPNKKRALDIDDSNSSQPAKR